MSILLLRLAGPMQAWGTQSRFTNRDTGLEPSKSGVIGLLCAALGRSREQPLNDFRGIEMAVRIDREGRLMRDYHTAGGEHQPAPSSESIPKDATRANRDHTALPRQTVAPSAPSSANAFISPMPSSSSASRPTTPSFKPSTPPYARPFGPSISAAKRSCPADRWPFASPRATCGASS